MPTARNNNNKKEHPNVKARILPHNDEAEQAVLGCVLISDDNTARAITPDNFGKVSEDPVAVILNELKESDFYAPAHKYIFRAMSELYGKSKPIDFVTLVQEVEEMGEMDAVGGLNYLSSLTSFVPSADNYRHYVDIVKKTSLLRQLIASGQKIMDHAFSGDAEEDALALAEREVYALSEKQDKSSLVDMNEALKKAMYTIDEKQRNPNEQNTVPIPFTKLNELLGGFHQSDLVLIAARPAQGKTSLGMNFISHAALDKSRKTPSGKVDPFKCAVFSLEMSAEQLATRLLCSVAKVSMEVVKNGKRTFKDTEQLVEAQKKLSEAQIYVDDSSLTTPIEILSKCRRLKREKGLDLVLVDYLQLMSSGKRTDSRQQEVADITRTKKIAANELNVPSLHLSQMSRDIEKRENKKPQMSDLRESGAIEQDADIIMFLHREHDVNDQTVDEDTRTKCDIIVAKHRNGRTDTVTVRWNGAYTTFTDLNAKPEDKTERKATQFKTNFIGAEEAEQAMAEKSQEPTFDPILTETPPPEESEGSFGLDDPFASFNSSDLGDEVI